MSSCLATKISFNETFKISYGVQKRYKNEFEQNLIIQASIPGYIMVVCHIFTRMQAIWSFSFLIQSAIHLALTIRCTKDTQIKIEITVFGALI